MRFLMLIVSLLIVGFVTSFAAPVQLNGPGADKSADIRQIDLDGLKKLLQRNPKDARPLLINFWATWCDPCREEFPDLVKIDADFKGKIEFLTVSLDDLDDIGTAVPKFLSQMKATMPAYLLSTADEDAAIAVISKDFHGNLPFTIL